jgi:hypothetical protein
MSTPYMTQHQQILLFILVYYASRFGIARRPEAVSDLARMISALHAIA